MVFNQDVFSELGFLLPQWRGLGIEMQFLQRKIMGVSTQTRACVGSNPSLLCDLRQASPLYFLVFCFLIFHMADYTMAVYIICKTDLGSNPGSATK